MSSSFMRCAVLSVLLPAALIVAGMLATRAHAQTPAQEIKEITLAQQFGAIFIPLMAMENLQLIEKQAAARGIGDLKINWAKMAGPSVMVDAIISGNLYFRRRACPRTDVDRMMAVSASRRSRPSPTPTSTSTPATPTSSRSATSPTRTASPCLR
jgi:hypothetical protein